MFTGQLELLVNLKCIGNHVVSLTTVLHFALVHTIDTSVRVRIVEVDGGYRGGFVSIKKYLVDHFRSAVLSIHDYVGQNSRFCITVVIPTKSLVTEN